MNKPQPFSTTSKAFLTLGLVLAMLGAYTIALLAMTPQRSEAIGVSNRPTYSFDKASNPTIQESALVAQVDTSETSQGDISGNTPATQQLPATTTQNPSPQQPQQSVLQPVVNQVAPIVNQLPKAVTPTPPATNERQSVVCTVLNAPQDIRLLGLGKTVETLTPASCKG